MFSTTPGPRPTRNAFLRPVQLYPKNGLTATGGGKFGPEQISDRSSSCSSSSAAVAAQAAGSLCKFDWATDEVPPELSTNFDARGLVGSGAFAVVLILERRKGIGAKIGGGGTTSTSAMKLSGEQQLLHDKCALKVLQNDEYPKRDIVCLLEQEIEAMQEFGAGANAHVNVMGAREVYQLPHHTFFLMELMDTTLVQYQKRFEHHRVPEPEAKKWIFQVLCGVSHLHSNKWAHRDLKPDNLLYNVREDVIKICDFGWACRILDAGHQVESIGPGSWGGAQHQHQGPSLDIGPNMMCGTAGFNAPEVGNYVAPSPPRSWGQQKLPPRLTAKVDVYTCGVVFFSFVCNTLYQPGNVRHEQLLSFLPGPLSDEGKSVCRVCLCADPGKRPTVWEVLERGYWNKQASGVHQVAADRPNNFNLRMSLGNNFQHQAKHPSAAGGRQKLLMGNPPNQGAPMDTEDVVASSSADTGAALPDSRVTISSSRKPRNSFGGTSLLTVNIPSRPKPHRQTISNWSQSVYATPAAPGEDLTTARPGASSASSSQQPSPTHVQSLLNMTTPARVLQFAAARVQNRHCVGDPLLSSSSSASSSNSCRGATSGSGATSSASTMRSSAQRAEAGLRESREQERQPVLQKTHEQQPLVQDEVEQPHAAHQQSGCTATTPAGGSFAAQLASSRSVPAFAPMRLFGTSGAGVSSGSTASSAAVVVPSGASPSSSSSSSSSSLFRGAGVTTSAAGSSSSTACSNGNPFLVPSQRQRPQTFKTVPIAAPALTPTTPTAICSPIVGGGLEAPWKLTTVTSKKSLAGAANPNAASGGSFSENAACIAVNMAATPLTPGRILFGGLNMTPSPAAQSNQAVIQQGHILAGSSGTMSDNRTCPPASVEPEGTGSSSSTSTSSTSTSSSASNRLLFPTRSSSSKRLQSMKEVKKVLGEKATYWKKKNWQQLAAHSTHLNDISEEDEADCSPRSREASLRRGRRGGPAVGAAALRRRSMSRKTSVRDAVENKTGGGHNDDEAHHRTRSCRSPGESDPAHESVPEEFDAPHEFQPPVPRTSPLALRAPAPALKTNPFLQISTTSSASSTPATCSRSLLMKGSDEMNKNNLQMSQLLLQRVVHPPESVQLATRRGEPPAEVVEVLGKDQQDRDRETQTQEPGEEQQPLSACACSPLASPFEAEADEDPAQEAAEEVEVTPSAFRLAARASRADGRGPRRDGPEGTTTCSQQLHSVSCSEMTPSGADPFGLSESCVIEVEAADVDVVVAAPPPPPASVAGGVSTSRSADTGRKINKRTTPSSGQLQNEEEEDGTKTNSKGSEESTLYAPSTSAPDAEDEEIEEQESPACRGSSIRDTTRSGASAAPGGQGTALSFLRESQRQNRSRQQPAYYNQHQPPRKEIDLMGESLVEVDLLRLREGFGSDGGHSGSLVVDTDTDASLLKLMNNVDEDGEIELDLKSAASTAAAIAKPKPFAPVTTTTNSASISSTTTSTFSTSSNMTASASLSARRFWLAESELPQMPPSNSVVNEPSTRLNRLNQRLHNGLATSMEFTSRSLKNNNNAHAAAAGAPVPPAPGAGGSTVASGSAQRDNRHAVPSRSPVSPLTIFGTTPAAADGRPRQMKAATSPSIGTGGAASTAAGTPLMPGGATSGGGVCFGTTGLHGLSLAPVTSSSTGHGASNAATAPAASSCSSSSTNGGLKMSTWDVLGLRRPASPIEMAGMAPPKVVEMQRSLDHVTGGAGEQAASAAGAFHRGGAGKGMLGVANAIGGGGANGQPQLQQQGNTATRNLALNLRRQSTPGIFRQFSHAQG